MDWGPVFAMAADRPASFSVDRHLSPSGLPDWIGAVARRYEHKISFIVKINHKELLTYRKNSDQLMFGKVQQAVDMGAATVGDGTSNAATPTVATASPHHPPALNLCPNCVIFK